MSNNEEENTRFDRFRSHVDRNRNVYFVGAACLTVGIVVGAAIVRTKVPGDFISVTGDHNIAVAGSKNTINKVVIELIERSTPSKPVHLVGTNLYFNSLSEAARETGHSLSRISQNVNGHIKDINGDVFEFLQPAT